MPPIFSSILLFLHMQCDKLMLRLFVPILTPPMKPTKRLFAVVSKHRSLDSLHTSLGAQEALDKGPGGTNAFVTPIGMHTPLPHH